MSTGNRIGAWSLAVGAVGVIIALISFLAPRDSHVGPEATTAPTSSATTPGNISSASAQSTSTAIAQSNSPTSSATVSSGLSTTTSNNFTVSLATLLGGGEKTIIVGGRIFRYVSSADNGYHGGGPQSSTCHSITVSAGIPDSEAADTSGGTLQILAESGGGGSVHVLPRSVSTGEFPLTPGALEFAVAISNAGIYWNASLQCTSPAGK